MKDKIRFTVVIIVSCISLFLSSEARAVVYTYDSNDASYWILDDQTIVSTLVVPDSYSIKDVNVVLNIEHTYVSDLIVYLISPNGTRVELFSGVGSSGDNFEGTILDDDADILINDGEAPFTGSYQPEGNLLDFFGSNPHGVWQLEVADSASDDEGYLYSWGLIIEPCPVPPAASNPSPVNGITDLPVNICLSWSVGNVSQDSTWDLYLGTSQNSLVRIASDLTELSYCPGPLRAGTRYYWRVNIKNPCLATPGPVWSFRITDPPVALCRDVTVTADRSCQVFLTVDDVDWHSYDPNGDPITLAIDSTGPYPVGVHTVTLTVTDDKGAVDTCTSTVRVMATAYCYTIDALDRLWYLISQDPTSEQLKEAIDYLNASLGESAPYNTIAENDRTQVVWAGPDRIAQWQGGFAGANVLDYQQQACSALKTYLQGQGAAYTNDIYDVWLLVAKAHKKLAETALSDADFQIIDASTVDQAKMLIREADTIAEKLSSEICDTALPKYEQAWKLAIGSLGTVVDWNRDGIVEYDDFISFFDEWLESVAP